MSLANKPVNFLPAKTQTVFLTILIFFILSINNELKAEESPLDKGLEWLAKNQEKDGHWDCVKHGGKKHDIAVTALAQMAFLKSGNDSKSGKYQDNVRASIKWLRKNADKKTGRIGMYRYKAGITLLAMSKALASGSENNLKSIVKKQVKDALKNQANNGGWGYKPAKDPQAAHVDTCVTGWWAMGIQTAKDSGTKVSKKYVKKALKYFENATQTKGDIITSGYVGPGSSSHMTAISFACLQILGRKKSNKFVKGQATAIEANNWMPVPPKKTKLARIKKLDYYVWFFQDLGFSQMGTKSKLYKKFKFAKTGILKKLQEKNGAFEGSWPHELKGTRTGQFTPFVGRVGVTAVCCMMLATDEEPEE